MPDFTTDELRNFLIRRTQETWSGEARPFYLAMVQPELLREGKDYKSAIGEETLSHFAKEIDKLELIRHPTQLAKIGLVPAGSGFTFEDTATTETPKSTEPISRGEPAYKGRVSRSEKTVLDFLRLLGKLDDNDIEGFNIPAKVPAKMVRI